MSKFIIRAVPSGIKFDLIAGNGQSIATSEVYETVAACRRGIASVGNNALKAKLEDLTEQGSPVTNPKFQLYQDRSGRFRFRLRSRNGKTIAISDAYVTKTGCRDGIDSVKEYAAQAALEEA